MSYHSSQLHPRKLGLAETIANLFSGKIPGNEVAAYRVGTCEFISSIGSSEVNYRTVGAKQVEEADINSPVDTKLSPVVQSNGHKKSFKSAIKTFQTLTEAAATEGTN